MSSSHRVFFAYPSGYPLIGPTIASAAKDATAKYDVEVHTWPQVDIAGKFIATEILQEIGRDQTFVADVSYPNFNVTFEIGYAIGLGKPIVLTCLSAIALQTTKQIDSIGILDTLGYDRYDNRENLATILAACSAKTPSRNCPRQTES